MKNLLLYAAIAVGGYFAYQKWDISQKRKWLTDFLANEPIAVEVIKRMTDKEIEYVYDYLKNYALTKEGEQMKPLPDWLQLEIQKISNKYNIFT